MVTGNSGNEAAGWWDFSTTVRQIEQGFAASNPAKQEEILLRAWERDQNLLAMELAFLLKVADGQQECTRLSTFSRPFVSFCLQKILLAKEIGEVDVQQVSKDLVCTFIAYRLHPKLAILATHL